MDLRWASVHYPRCAFRLIIYRLIYGIVCSVFIPPPSVPELFPKNKSTALALYNCAIYLGRALSFAAVIAARAVGGDAEGFNVVNGSGGNLELAAAGLILVPLDSLDLRLVSIV
jgi:MFS family permease